MLLPKAFLIQFGGVWGSLPRSRQCSGWGVPTAICPRPAVCEVVWGSVVLVPCFACDAGLQVLPGRVCVGVAGPSFGS